MKTSILKKVSFIIFISFCFFSASAQLKVANNGYVGIRTLSPNYYVDIEGPLSNFYRDKSGYKPYTICFWGKDPRLESESQIVFYSSDNTGFIDIQCKHVYEYSDSSAKIVTGLLKDKGLEKVLNLYGVQYQWKSDQENGIDKVYTGFLAQDVEKVIPEAVTKDDSIGKYLMSYSSIIPYLCEAIKEQQEQIKTLQDIVTAHEEEIIALKQQITSNTKGSSSTLKSANVTTNVSNPQADSQKSGLFQNVPNPFQNDTEIKYNLAAGTQDADIYIYNLQGRQIKSFSLSGNGLGNVIIKGNELEPGMYIYSLVVDKQLIDTKRMILTK